MQFERKGNPAIRKDGSEFDLGVFMPKYFLVPMELIDTHRAEPEVFTDIENALIVTKKNQMKYLRWFVNPDDRKYVETMGQFLKKEGYDHSLHIYPGEQLDEQLGYRSASRSSLIVPVEKNLKPFFYKSSTNNTAGHWSDKKVNGNQVRKAVISTQLSNRVRWDYIPDSNLVTFKEPVGYVIEDSILNQHGLDQGIVFRDFGEYGNDDRRQLIPGFTIIHETMGPEIAAKNSKHKNANKPSEYWKEFYAIPFGKASADFIFLHQLQVSSNHSQQYLIQIDKNFRPKKEFFFRDFNDSDYLTSMWTSPVHKEFRRQWMIDYSATKLEFVFGLFKGSELPSWMKGYRVDDWAKASLQAFEKRFSHNLGVSVRDLKASRMSCSMNMGNTINRYRTCSYNLNDPIFEKWVKAADCFKGEKETQFGLSCKKVLSCFKMSKKQLRKRFRCRNINKALMLDRNLKSFNWKQFLKLGRNKSNNCNYNDNGLSVFVDRMP
ncbi:hypothetical protein OAB57_00305 [Bacteriovoracaceae bacterium]|nr:hypothetical protein [Bacteriovoracaceae bacterium]